ncbi:helix-turn-helix domain-containing protein [Saccharopolyspora shandongensis]|uniref:helix-turn-helix domain-containing protein n=1 Tax=Saccharopolyspora shandongensis TaxID=418495 RepID=UPI0033C9DFD0
MKANSARRYRLYPDDEQAERLTSWAHSCRAVWNYALAQRIWAYKSARRVTIRAAEQHAQSQQGQGATCGTRMREPTSLVTAKMTRGITES